MSRTPATTALRAFEAVARHGTLTGAATELCVTPAAISHRLNDLNAASHTPLLQRQKGRFIATPQGLAVLHQLGDAFQRIAEAHDLITRPPKKTLEAVVSYSFASMWLLPNIVEFQRLFPDIRISIGISHSPVEDTRSSTVLTVVHSASQPEGTTWHKLFDDICGIVAACDHPILADRRADWRSRLRDYPLVHVSHDGGDRRGEFSWRDWAEALGIGGISFPVSIHVTAEHAALEVCQSGQNLALVSLVNSDRAIRAGGVSFVDDSRIRSGKSYWYRIASRSQPIPQEIRDFVNWMKSKCAESVKRYDTVTAA